MTKCKIFKSTLKKQIEGGKLQPGSILSSEHVLAKSSMMSRHTIRQALNELASEGYLRRSQGKRSVVSDKYLQKKKTLRIFVPDFSIPSRLEQLNTFFTRQTGIRVKTQLEIFNPADAEATINKLKNGDLIFLSTENLDFFVNNNLLVPPKEIPALSSLISGDNVMEKLIRFGVRDGVCQAPPVFFSPLVLIININLFNQAGITPPTRYQTLDALLSDAEQLARPNPEKKSTGLVFNGHWSRLNYFLRAWYSEEPWKKQNICACINRLKKIHENGSLFIGSDHFARRVFHEGRAAIFLSTYFEIQELIASRPFQFDLCGMPQLPDIPNFFRVTAAGIIRKQGFPKNAVSYLEHFYSEKFQYFMRASGGGIPVISSAAYNKISQGENLPQNYLIF